MGKKPVGCNQFVLINLISSRLNVDDDEFTFVFRANARAYLLVVNFIAEANKLLFAVPGFWYEHFISPLQLQAAKITLLKILNLGGLSLNLVEAALFGIVDGQQGNVVGPSKGKSLCQFNRQCLWNFRDTVSEIARSPEIRNSVADFSCAGFSERM